MKCLPDPRTLKVEGKEQEWFNPFLPRWNPEQKAVLENTPAQHGPGKHRRTHMEPDQKKILGDCGFSLSTITYGVKCD